jgi:hypothetical protein
MRSHLGNFLEGLIKATQITVADDPAEIPPEQYPSVSRRRHRLSRTCPLFIR